MSSFPHIECLLTAARATLKVMSPPGTTNFVATLRAESGPLCFDRAEEGPGIGPVLSSLEEYASKLVAFEEWPKHGGVYYLTEVRHRFSKGQRVVLVDEQHDSDPGMVGTVMEDASAPWVLFDTPTRYITRWHKLPGADSYTDCVEGEALRLLVDQTPNPAHAALHAIEAIY